MKSKTAIIKRSAYNVTFHPEYEGRYEESREFSWLWTESSTRGRCAYENREQGRDAEKRTSELGSIIHVEM